MSEHLQCQCQPESTASICPPGTTAGFKVLQVTVCQVHLAALPPCKHQHDHKKGENEAVLCPCQRAVSVQTRNEKEWGLESGIWQKRSFLTLGSQLHTASPPGPCHPLGWSRCTNPRPVGKGDTRSNNEHLMYHEHLFLYLPPPFGEQWLDRNLLILEIHTEVPKSS